MGVKMIVLKAFRPGGSGSAEVRPGSLFVASTEAQAKLWRAIGFCEDAPEEPEPQPRPELPKRTYTYARKVMDPDKPAESVLEKTEPTSDNPPKRKYQRRDLKAED